MASKIDIISNALILIGDDPIQSLDDPGFGATVMKNIYDGVYQDVLSRHPWGFALKEQSLSQLSQSPDSRTGFNYAYQVPTDLVRIWQIMEHSNYVIIGDLLYSNLNSLLCRYVYAVEETALPAYCVKAIEYKLAADAATAITENNGIAQDMANRFLMQMATAMATDSQNRPQSEIVDSPFVDVRFGGGRGIYSSGWG